jgi:osmoprotectant transport system permease protein
VNLIGQGFAWIFDGAHWVTSNGNAGIGVRIGEHFYYTGVSLLVTVIIAVPLGLFIGHTGKGRTAAITLSNASRALPTLGLLAVLILALSTGLLPVVIVLVILGIPPLLAGVYAGIESVDKQTVDAARAIGMTELQILFRVEIPLGFALIFGGFRAATLQVIATVTLAAYYSLGGLGHYLVFGLAQNDYPQMVAGAILVIVIALLVDGILAVVQRFVVPRGVSRGMTGRKNTARGGAIPTVATTRTLIKEGQ